MRNVDHHTTRLADSHEFAADRSESAPLPKTLPQNGLSPQARVKRRTPAAMNVSISSGLPSRASAPSRPAMTATRPASPEERSRSCAVSTGLGLRHGPRRPGVVRLPRPARLPSSLPHRPPPTPTERIPGPGPRPAAAQAASRATHALPSRRRSPLLLRGSC